MRRLLLAFCLITGCYSVAQEITPQQQVILEQFELSAADHRGVEFQLENATNQAQYPDMKTALEGYFTTAVKRDYVIITVASGDPTYLNTPMGILEQINLYLELTNNLNNE